MLADFHTETEDESPREVSKELVALHNELVTGNAATMERLRQSVPAAVNTSVRQTVGILGACSCDVKLNYYRLARTMVHCRSGWLFLQG